MASVSTPDLCVIGAGASGLAVAEAARRLGATVVVVEKGAPAGQRFKSGALALSALRETADRAGLLTRAAPFGVLAETPRISYRRLHDHIAEVISRSATQSAAGRLSALGVELIKGTGSFVDARTLRVDATPIRARRFLVATGAHSVMPDVPGLLSVPSFTTETIFDNTRKLTHLAIVGAGAMALEIGLSYRRLGSEVTIIEPGRALAGSDPELAEIALRRLGDEGVVLHQQATILAILARSQGIGLSVRAGEQLLNIDVSHILVAAGRTPNLDELNLEAARIRRSKLDPRLPALNAALRTTNPRIYAVGEATGHAANLTQIEADAVVRAALLGENAQFDPLAMPRLTLTDPEIAEIGLTEPLARARLKSGFAIYRASYAENDKARAARDGMGVLKLVVNRHNRILGAGIVGRGAGEVIALVSLAMARDIAAHQLADLAAPYPSHADLVRDVAAQAAANAPRDRWLARRLAFNRLLP